MWSSYITYIASRLFIYWLHSEAIHGWISEQLLLYVFKLDRMGGMQKNIDELNTLDILQNWAVMLVCHQLTVDSFIFLTVSLLLHPFDVVLLLLLRGKLNHGAKTQKVIPWVLWKNFCKLEKVILSSLIISMILL